MKKHNSVLLTLSLMAFFALGISTQSQAQTSRLAIKKPISGTGVTLDNESGGNTLFSIGGSEKMRLTSDGKLGLGSSNLTRVFTIARNTEASTGQIELRNIGGISTGNYDGLFFTQGTTGNTPLGSLRLMYNSNGQPDWAFYTRSGSSEKEQLRILNNGNVGIGTTTPSQKLDVYGNIAVSGSTVHTSDARFKKNIQTIDNEAVAKLSQVRGTSYQFRTKEFKNKNFDEGKQLGLIAQELMKVYPELVSKGADGYYSVNYTGLIPVLVEAVKDLRKKNAVLKDNSQAIKAELDTLKSRMAALEKLLIKAKK